MDKLSIASCVFAMSVFRIFLQLYKLIEETLINGEFLDCFHPTEEDFEVKCQCIISFKLSTNPIIFAWLSFVVVMLVDNEIRKEAVLDIDAVMGRHLLINAVTGFVIATIKLRQYLQENKSLILTYLSKEIMKGEQKERGMYSYYFHYP